MQIDAMSGAGARDSSNSTDSNNRRNSSSVHVVECTKNRRRTNQCGFLSKKHVLIVLIVLELGFLMHAAQALSIGTKSVSRFSTFKSGVSFMGENRLVQNARRSNNRQCKIGMHLAHQHQNVHQSQNEAFHWKQVVPSRRITSRIAFSALVTLVPPLFLRNHSLHALRLTKTDWAAFAVTSVALTLSQKMKQQVQIMVSNAKRMRQGLVKHTSQLGEYVNSGKKSRIVGADAADRVTYLGVVVNLFLSVVKALVGVTCNSAALVADAGHSLSDLLSDFITLCAVKIGRIPPDDDHPYGHGKFESIGSLFISLFLLATGLSIGAVFNTRLIEILSVQFSSNPSAGVSRLLPEIPTFPCLVTAFISIVSKEWLYKITRKVGEKINSQVVIANAWHHRTDAYSSVLALISIAISMTFPSLVAVDSAAGLLVAGMICMTGFEILVDSIKQLTDTNNEALVKRIHKLIEKEETRNEENFGTGDVLDIQRVRSRQVGSMELVDVMVSTPESLSSSATRAIEDRIKYRILEEEGIGANTSDGEGTVFDAEVHAVSSGTKNCPLLLATSINEHHDDKAHMSASEVEEMTRSVLKSHPKVKSVQGVTVHYHDTLLIDVDAQIRLIDPEATTVTTARFLAEELKDNLENIATIDKARIFLDLNEKLDDLNPLGFNKVAALSP